MDQDATAPEPQSVLVVDDVPENIELLSETLRSYRIRAAASGERALKIAFSDTPPDLILLDIMMPGMDGHAVCARLKAEPATRNIPVIFITARGDIEDETRCLELGGVDFIAKPINPAVVRARVKTHLALYAQTRALQRMITQLEVQADELARWNRTLEERVADGVAQIGRLSMLKRFFSPAVANLIVAGETEDPLRTHRSEIVVVFLDLRGFTAFTETADPEEVMGVLAEYHAAMGEIILAHDGTIERFFGDGIMIVFNDPLPLPTPALVATQMAILMQQRFAVLAHSWLARGYALGLGIGLAQGYATLGAIGCEGRREYSATGTVCNLAARLCAEAAGGRILVSQRIHAALGTGIATEPAGELALKGFNRPVPAYRVRTAHPALDTGGKAERPD